MSMLATNRSKPLSECIATAMPGNIGQIRTTACLSAPNRAHAHVKVGRQWLGNVRCAPAASTDRRNTSVKSLCWGFKLQGLAWSLVELTRYFVEMSLRVHRQVGALRKVLPQQTIGVLI